MSEKETKKPEVTETVKSEGGDMKIKSKPKKFSTKKDEPIKFKESLLSQKYYLLYILNHCPWLDF